MLTKNPIPIIKKAISIDRSLKYSNIALRRVRAMINGELKIRKIGTKKHTPSGKVATVPVEWKR